MTVEFITDYIEWFSLSAIGATFLLTLVFATIILRRQSSLGTMLLDIERMSRILSRLEIDIQELRAVRENCRISPPVPESVSTSTPKSTISRSFSPDSALEKKHRVACLAQKGLNTEDIARKLNMYRGEAELLLNLSRYFKDGLPEKDDALVQ